MIYAFIGWCWETPFASIIEEKRFVNRGFLYGPFIPIYAFGILLIISVLEKLTPYIPEGRVYKFLTVFVITGILCSALEYIVSYSLEKMFKTRWWDYSHMKFNLNGRVNFLYSIGWGVGGNVVWFVIYPLVTAFAENIPINYRTNIASAFLAYFAMDFSLTVKELISLRKIMSDLSNISKQLKGKVVYNVDFIKDGLGNTYKRISQTMDIGQEKVLDSLENAQSRIKTEWIYLRVKSGMSLSDHQKMLVQQYNHLLEKTRFLSRFYRNYPKAQSKPFGGLVQVIRKKFRRFW